MLRNYYNEDMFTYNILFVNIVQIRYPVEIILVQNINTCDGL